ncbi:MAG: right-handed parallel beta-helix repeat-containing protein [Gemmatimonadota bacterium]|nr:right-handed parallel beta-helix repeat-containing protein [Gemmatimonadota bacterium]
MTFDRRAFFTASGGLIAGMPLPLAPSYPAPPQAADSTAANTVSVRAAPFLARGDGRSNDTAAIQAALNSVAAAGGGVVEIPAGDYLVDTLTIPAARGGTLRIVGQGWSYDAGATSRVVSASARPMFEPRPGANGLELSMLHLDGNDLGTIGWNGAHGNKARLYNLLIDRFTRYGIYFDQGLCELRHSYVRLNRGTGVRASSDGWFSGNEIAANGGVGLIVAAGGNRITDNLINSNGSYGIHITGRAGSNQINSVIGGYIGENVAQNIMVEGASTADRNVNYTSIVGCFIQQVSGKRAGAIRVVNARQTQIIGINYLGGPNDTGCISMQSCDSSQVTGIAASYSSGNIVRLAACDDVSVSGVTSRDHALAATRVDESYMIHIGDGCHRCTVTDVRATDARVKAYSRGIKNTGQGTIILGSYAFTGAPDPDAFGGAAVMTFDLATRRWISLNGRG